VPSSIAGTLGFEPDERKIRKPTPFESELRATESVSAGTRSVWQRLLTWRRQKRDRVLQAPGGYVILGLARLGVAFAAGAGVAVLVARLFDRSLAIGFYIAGAAVLALAFFLSAADEQTPYYYGRDEREYRVSVSLSYGLVGLVLLGFGVVLETV
jgi:hypothetical protein